LCHSKNRFKQLPMSKSLSTVSWYTEVKTMTRTAPATFDLRITVWVPNKTGERTDRGQFRTKQDKDFMLRYWLAQELHQLHQFLFIPTSQSRTESVPAHQLFYNRDSYFGMFDVNARLLWNETTSQFRSLAKQRHNLRHSVGRGHGHPQIFSISRFCALRGGVPNKILLLT